jgi:anti-sigma B factor antagonist
MLGMNGPAMATPTVHLSGELDAALTGALRGELFALSDECGADELVLDLSDVTFIDSTGLGLLVGLARRRRDGGGATTLLGCRRSIRRVLTLTGIDGLFELQPQSALARDSAVWAPAVVTDPLPSGAGGAPRGPRGLADRPAAGAPRPMPRTLGSLGDGSQQRVAPQRHGRQPR